MPTVTQPLDVGRKDIWEQHGPTLRQLYQTQRKTLSEVKTLMERDHGFPVTPLSTYESKLRQMRVRKKMKKTYWHAVYQELQRRGERRSAVYLCGTKIPSTKAWKEIRRSGARSSHDGQQNQLPREVVVRTPSPRRQSSPLPMVSSCGIPSSQTVPAMLQMTTRPPPDISSFECVLGLSDTIPDFYKTFLKHTPSQIFKQELFKIFEKSLTISSISGGAHMDLINLRDLSAVAYMLSNNLLDPIDRHRSLDAVFNYFPTGLLIPLIAVDLPALRVVFDTTLEYLFHNDRRDEFQALVRVIAHHHSDWLASEGYKYLFYAATMNCLDVCRLLLNIVKNTSLSYGTSLQDWGYPLLESTIVAISVGYFDCARLLIQHGTQNYPLPRDYDHDSNLPPDQTGQAGALSHNQEYSDNQVTSMFLHAIAIIRDGNYWRPYNEPMTIHTPRMLMPSYLKAETVQHVLDIFLELGLDVDAPMPPWLQDDAKNMSPNDEDLVMRTLYPNLQLPVHLYPTVLDIVYYIHKDAYHHLARHSKKVATRVTRSGLYLAAENGSGSLYQYLNSLQSEAAECQELLGLVLAEQFMIRFDYNIAYTLLSFGVGLEAFPPDISLSIPLEGLIFQIKEHGMKMEFLSIFNHLLREGAIIDADVIAAAVEPHGTNLLNFFARYGANFATSGTLALLLAARLDNFEAVDWLLEAGVDINAGINFDGQVVSVIGGFVLYAIDRHQKPASSKLGVFDGAPPRKRLLFEEKRDAILPRLKKLIDRGAALRTSPGNLQPNDFLHRAILYGIRLPDILDIVKYTLVAQGGVQIPSPRQPCLLEACFNANFYAKPDGSKEIMDRKQQIFNVLLACGAPIANSGVLVHLIRLRVTMDSIQMVIDRGANINMYSGEHSVFNLSPRTPLQMAAEVGDLELVKMLADNGARINAPAKGACGMTALQAACRRSGEKWGAGIALVNFLIDKGADVNAPGSPDRGLTALQIAAWFGNIELAAVLLDHGADINALSGKKRRVLDYAAEYGRLDMTKFLLELGALSGDRGENDYAGAIKVAEKRRHWAVADLLREHAILSTQIRRALEGDML